MANYLDLKDTVMVMELVHWQTLGNTTDDQNTLIEWFDRTFIL